MNGVYWDRVFLLVERIVMALERLVKLAEQYMRFKGLDVS